LTHDSTLIVFTMPCLPVAISRIAAASASDEVAARSISSLSISIHWAGWTLLPAQQ
jgi:hypothetical protein